MDHLEYHGEDVIYVTFNYDLASEPVSHPGERLPTSPVALVFAGTAVSNAATVGDSRFRAATTRTRPTTTSIGSTRT